MRKYLWILVCITTLVACNNEPGTETEIEHLDLLNSKFNDNVFEIFGHWLEEDTGTSLDTLKLYELSDEKLKYRIKDPVINVIHITVPKKEFGYLFESPFIDSLASYGPLYFNTVSTVTDLNKKPVAYQALAFYSDENKRDSVLKELFKDLGTPTDESIVNAAIGIKAHEWILNDRTIQIVSFNAQELSASSFSPNKKYYQVDFLMIDNNQKEALKNAHIYEFTEGIKLDDKVRDYSYFNLDQKQLFSDRFLLYSDEKKNNFTAGNLK